jgi:mannose-6-phosphate isomerase-like protein (cupin superfamily)
MSTLGMKAPSPVNKETRMSAYTRKNLQDVEDSAVKFGFDDHQEARFASDDLDTEQTGFSFHRVKPGMRQAFAHRHDDAEEVYVVVGGTGRVKLDDDIVDLERLDAVRLAPGVTRQFEGGPEGIEILVFGARHAGDGETISDWWTE